MRPDVVLFNGGFFMPDELRGRVQSVLASWFEGTDPGWTPRVLVNRSPATAVADGAAYFGLVRHGHGVRIGGGSPRSYYIGLRRAESADVGDGSQSDAEIQAVCILPHGIQEGTTLDLTDRSFFVSSNQVLAFTLWSSRTRGMPRARSSLCPNRRSTGTRRSSPSCALASGRAASRFPCRSKHATRSSARWP